MSWSLTRIVAGLIWAAVNLGLVFCFLNLVYVCENHLSNLIFQCVNMALGGRYLSLLQH